MVIPPLNAKESGVGYWLLHLEVKLLLWCLKKPFPKKKRKKKPSIENLGRIGQRMRSDPQLRTWVLVHGGSRQEEALSVTAGVALTVQ